MRLFLGIFLFAFISFGQELSGDELLEKAIVFHDPNGNWETFKASFQVSMKTPNSQERISDIQINLPKEEFVLDVTRGANAYTYHIAKDSCKIVLNGSSKITTEERQKLRLNCERGTVMKDYYTYLYGLPMKLKDPGTIVNEKVEKKVFKGKEYYVLKVNYTEAVGKDVWYFYFDPVTYAMEVYQFYHDQNKNDGEYIILEDMEIVNEIKMPKTRAWYYNKDNKYLGTDILSTN